MFLNVTVGRMSYANANSQAASFSPKSVSGVTFWYDASDASSKTISGINVTAWNDKSGNGNHTTQALLNTAPFHTASGINGLATINFNGGINNPYLQTASTVNIGGSASFSGVIKPAIMNTTARILLGHDTQDVWALEWASDFLQMYDGTRYYYVGTAGKISLNTPFIYTQVSTTTPATGHIYINGVEVIGGGGTSGAFYSWVFSRLGRSVSNTAGTMDVGELCGHAKAYSTLERNNIESYYSAKWGIALP